MSVLVIQIEPRNRLQAGEPAGAAKVAVEFGFVLSSDGVAVTQQGRAAASRLPRAETVVAVLADEDVGWHRTAVPRAPAARVRAALAGALEETVLDDVDTLHFALAPNLAPGQTGWVAAVQRPWLAATLAELERAGVPVDRVVPLSAPGEPAEGHFLPGPTGDDSAPRLVVSHADGVACLRLTGSLARQWVARAGADTLRWTAHPAVATAAEQWLGAPVGLVNDAERAVRAARSSWNLRQFELLPRHRGTLAARDLWRRVFSPAWRPVRWGLVALVALQLVGLNAWAWRLQHDLGARRLAMNTLLKATHPQVRSVLDAGLQMERETEALRAAAGKAGDADLETLLSAAAAAWPDGQEPVQTLRFESGKLTLAASGWNPQQLTQFRDRLRPAGLNAELADGRITLTRAAAARAAG